VTHYGKIVVALKETIRLMQEIDEIIPSWPIEQRPIMAGRQQRQGKVDPGAPVTARRSIDRRSTHE